MWKWDSFTKEEGAKYVYCVECGEELVFYPGERVRRTCEDCLRHLALGFDSINSR